MEELTFEEGISKLEEITKKLESGELSLDEQFKLYKEGVELVNRCNEKLDTVVIEVKILGKEGENDEL